MDEAIHINKSAERRIVEPTPQIIQPRLFVVHIPAIPKRLHPAQRFRQLTGTPQRRAPRIVHITNNNISIRIKNCNDSTGKHRRCDTTAAVRIFLKPLRELECSNSLPFSSKEDAYWDSSSTFLEFILNTLLVVTRNHSSPRPHHLYLHKVQHLV